jgi:hypothetical protein
MCYNGVHTLNTEAKEETVTVRQLRSDWVQIKRRVARGEHFDFDR